MARAQAKSLVCVMQIVKIKGRARENQSLHIICVRLALQPLLWRDLQTRWKELTSASSLSYVRPSQESGGFLPSI